jgi:hypothetical protein
LILVHWDERSEGKAEVIKRRSWHTEAVPHRSRDPLLASADRKTRLIVGPNTKLFVALRGRVSDHHNAWSSHHLYASCVALSRNCTVLTG